MVKIMAGRVLAVDPGEKRIGIALSDPTRSLAAPLAVIKHVSLVEDCRKVIEFGLHNEAGLIVVGQALGGDGELTRQAKHSLKIAETLQAMTEIPVVLWDESGSTRAAQEIAIRHSITRKGRSGHLDDQAAAVILQSYLDDGLNQETE